MDNPEMLELLNLKARQRRLQELVAGLGTDLERLEARIAPLQPPTPAECGTEDRVVIKPALQPLRIQTPLTSPPIISTVASPPEAPIAAEAAQPTTLRPEAPAAEPIAAEEPPTAWPESKLDTPAPLLSTEPPFTTSSTAIPSEPSAGLEVRIGKYWFVRVGVVLLLTGLVFLGHYAYQNWIGLLGPAAKLTLLYIVSGTLLGTGAWLQRREPMRNYAQVLLAGGMAAVYFTTYAAHHVERLRVIQSPVLDGMLLLGWAGFMVWMADRRKSEVLALFSVGLAYYTSVITRTGAFTLYSNLLLTAAALFFLVRNRWAALSVASLLATYLGYAFWRFYDGAAWHWAMPGEGLWFGASFLAAYWTLFTAAVFLSRHEHLQDINRATFLSLNNGAFFGLFLLTMWQTHTGGFWKVALVFGLVLTACAGLAARLLRSETVSQHTYLTQGLVLITVGIIAKFTGMQLALMLAAESLVLLALGLRLQNPVMRIGAHVSGPLAVGWALAGLQASDAKTLYLGTAVGAFMFANVLVMDRHLRNCTKLFRIRVTWFALLAMLSWVGVTWVHAERGDLATLYAAQAVLLTFSFYLLRVREVVWISQGIASLGVLCWLGNAVAAYGPWHNHWQPALLTALLFVLGHWWERPRMLAAPHPGRTLLSVAYGLQILIVLMSWTQPHFAMDPWITVLCAMTLGMTVYGAATRFWSVAACAQVALIAAAGLTVFRMLETHPAQWHMLSPAATFALLVWAKDLWLKAHPLTGDLRSTVDMVERLYRWFTVALVIAWVAEFVLDRDRVWVFAGLGFVAFIWAGLRRNPEMFVQSAVLTGVGLLFYLSLWTSPQASKWANLLPAVLLITQQRLARRVPRFEQPDPIHSLLICAGCATLFSWLTHWVVAKASGTFFLTASWSVLALALFGAGMLWRERLYRWLGLAMIGLALGRIVLFDVWRLDTVYRILSFMALGVVLVVLGYIYNRYQDKIREWL